MSSVSVHTYGYLDKAGKIGWAVIYDGIIGLDSAKVSIYGGTNYRISKKRSERIGQERARLLALVIGLESIRNDQIRIANLTTNYPHVQRAIAGICESTWSPWRGIERPRWLAVPENDDLWSQLTKLVHERRWSVNRITSAKGSVAKRRPPFDAYHRTRVERDERLARLDAELVNLAHIWPETGRGCLPKSLMLPRD